MASRFDVLLEHHVAIHSLALPALNQSPRFEQLQAVVYRVIAQVAAPGNLIGLGELARHLNMVADEVIDQIVVADLFHHANEHSISVLNALYEFSVKLTVSNDNIQYSCSFRSNFR